MSRHMSLVAALVASLLVACSASPTPSPTTAPTPTPQPTATATATPTPTPTTTPTATVLPSQQGCPAAPQFTQVAHQLVGSLQAWFGAQTRLPQMSCVWPL